MPFNKTKAAPTLSIATLLLALALQSAALAEGDKPIVDIRFNAPYGQIASSHGDEWAPTWADDDVLYTGNDDGTSFGGIEKEHSITFGKLTGDDFYNLQGATITNMGDYGK